MRFRFRLEISHAPEINSLKVIVEQYGILKSDSNVTQLIFKILKTVTSTILI